MMRWYYSIWLALSTFSLSILAALQTNPPVVRAVLFYSPYCPHCHQVITEDLPPLFEKYGDQLQIIGVDTTSPGGDALFLAAIERFQIPSENQAVPMLIVDDVILLGSLEIPEVFPTLIDQYLAQGGVDWPDIPGLREAITSAEQPPTPTTEGLTPSEAPAQPEATASPTALIEPVVASEDEVPTPLPTVSSMILADNPSASLKDRIARDPVGNGLAIIVLVGMVFTVGGTTFQLRSATELTQSSGLTWAIPMLCAIGLGIAAYLSYVELRQVTAVCGPVGDCNTVQQSEYARLFGVLPIGVLGLFGYVTIVGAWAVGRFGQGKIADFATVALLALTLPGTLFSIYLTYLEPFVIGATCAWCLSSAVITTALFWLSVFPGKNAISRLRFGNTHAIKRSRV